jgi:RNA polymerase sigma-70 factor (ECF subfamily)
VTPERAFVALRPAMFALAYRITGNRADADEIVQDAFVRLHDAAPGDAVRSLKAYLATITARLSLNRLRDRQARRETYFGEWLPEPVMTEGDAGVRAEDVSFALMVVGDRPPHFRRGRPGGPAGSRHLPQDLQPGPRAYA